MSLSFRLSRYVFEFVFPFLEWLLFKLVFPNGLLHRIGKWYYYHYFDSKIRQSPLNPSKLSDLQEDYQNPLVVGRKRRRMHAAHQSFFSKEAALSYWRDRQIRGIGMMTAEKERFLITGKCGEPTVPWRFQLLGHPNDAPKSWFTQQFDDAAWNEVMLPNHWQLQGFDLPIYTNTSYPFRFDPPFTERDGSWTNTLCDLGLGSSSISSAALNPKEPGVNATGLYRKAFFLPSEWKTSISSLHHHQQKENRQFRYFLVFEGADANLSVWLNDRYVGYSQDSCLPSEFEVTELLLEEGENLLAAMVNRWCDGSYLEDQDKWWLSGIYREVYIVRKPVSYIDDYEWSANPAQAGELSLFTLRVSVIIDQPLNSGEQSISVELWDPTLQQMVGQITTTTSLASSNAETNFPARNAADAIIDPETADHEIPDTSRSIARIEISVQQPLLWSAESPNLYTLFISLLSARPSSSSHYEAVHTVSSRVGFRTVKVGGSQHTLCINNKTVLLAGINRHEFNCKTGRAVSRTSMLEDALILKSLNFNAVRLSHYPQHCFWLELCDELGLYVIDEANIETHGFQVFGQPIGYLSDQADWRGAMSSRIARMFERDKNFISVIGWSLGNESGLGKTHELMANWLHIRDPFRFVQYESGGARSKVTDVICPMYLKPAWCIEQSQIDEAHRPVILCEYAHAMGNSGGVLHRYWELFWDQINYPRIQGGFIWDLVDQGLAINPNVRGFQYGGDFGDLPNTHNFCCNGILAADRSLYPSAYAVQNLQLPIALNLKKEGREYVLMIENRRMFESLDDVELHCSLMMNEGFFNATSILSSFVVNEIGLQAGMIRKVKISQRIEESFLDAAVSAEAEQRGSVWLDVIVKKVKNSSLWNSAWCNNSKEVEIGHFSFEGDYESFLARSLSIEAKPALSAAPSSSYSQIKVDANDLNRLKFFAAQVQVVIDKLTGCIVEYTHIPSNLNLLSRPIDYSIFRAPTDNDIGGGDVSYAARWRAAGYDQLILKPSVSAPTSLHWKIDYERNVCNIQCSWTLIPSQTSISSPSAPNPPSNIEIPVQARYTLYGNGDMDIEMSIIPSSYLPALPRCGVRFAIPSSYERVRWFGFGPHEAYDDRLDGVYLGTFDCEIDQEMHTPYIRPQENGRRADPRWILFVGNAELPSLGIIPNISQEDRKPQEKSHYGFNVSRFSVEELTAKNHDYELEAEEDRAVHVHLDSRMMGLGGYDSWSPHVDQEFLIKPTGEKITTRFRLSLMQAGP